MIYIYPANRLENLVILLDRVMQLSQSSNILSEEIILVQSKGMQHWLNLQLAQNRGISMNLGFRLPVQFFWEQIRLILGREQVPEHSPYSREVLSWRIDRLLASDVIKNSQICQQATQYWYNSKTGFSDHDKRFQLAQQLADLFEQYQIYRPDWIQQWLEGPAENFPAQQWQALLWQQLVAEIPDHPVALLRRAIKDVAGAVHLPERISLFGINSLPPLWLDFLSVLGEHCQVHLFHLNPCVEYWGDLKTEKALAREQFYRWVKKGQAADPLDMVEQPGNPLLANLGGQGREFLYLLQECSSIEIPVFESPLDDLSASDQAGPGTGSGNSSSENNTIKQELSVLRHLQQDILELTDGRQAPKDIQDASISFTSAHSALREIQALHDWLLHQFNNDSTLTPKDVLVMCPNIENYAPYVEAVFAPGLNVASVSEKLPPLPCSIADRSLKDSEPLVQAFMQCLELPDSRFQVNAILAFLRLPAVQQKFSLQEDEIQILENWLKQAAVHWGLDQEHKQKIIGSEQVSNHFSWSQGLKRLLLGFAHSDQPGLYQKQLLLGNVEGDEGVLLGRFLQLLEQLKYYTLELQKPRTAQQWQSVLQQLKEELFADLPEDVLASDIIQQAINDLGEYTASANYQDPVIRVVIRDFLHNHFNQPEPGRQFLSGQVTFCSMVPMRSLPFRIIAVLGLNDSDFPRHRQPMGFDLMAREAPRRGDRSRRGDDRYLFLEALISCRDKLYLSYQGHDIKTNSQREPSLVLSELMAYLEQAYGWRLGVTRKSRANIFQLPLQAFSKDNYRQQRKSFNEQWLKLSEALGPMDNLKSLPPLSEDEVIRQLPLDELILFFNHPVKYFAQKRLRLFAEAYDQVLPEDNEPFEASYLDRYILQQEMTELQLKGSADELQEYLQCALASGNLPDIPDIETQLTAWQQQSRQFAQLIQQREGDSIHYHSALLSVSDKEELQLEVNLPLAGDKLLLWRLATPKGKDDISLWLNHLAAQIYCQQQGLNYSGAEGLYRGSKDSFLSVSLLPVNSPEVLLQELIRHWQKGLQQALLLNADLGRAHCYNKFLKKPRPMTVSGFYGFWKGTYNSKGLQEDPYIQWFWQGQPVPQWEQELKAAIEAVYEPLYQLRQEQVIELSND